MLIKVPVQLLTVSGLQIALGFRAPMNDPVGRGSFSILPLLRLFAELSQIDDLAHLGLLESVGRNTRAHGADRAPYAITVTAAPAVNRILM